MISKLTLRSFSLSCISMLIYGAIILHRQRKGTLSRGNYSPATAETGYGQQGFAYGGTQAPAGDYTVHNQPKPVGYSGDYYGNNASYEMQGNNGRY